MTDQKMPRIEDEHIDHVGPVDQADLNDTWETLPSTVQEDYLDEAHDNLQHAKQLAHGSIPVKGVPGYVTSPEGELL